MSDRDDFQARLKCVKGRARNKEFTMPELGRRQEHHHEEVNTEALAMAILRPQLVLVLGFIALIVGRSIAMNVFGIEPSTELLGLGEGIVVLALLVVLGVLFGLTEYILHGALVVGAALAFMLESYYIPAIPGLIEQVYTPGYVNLVVLWAQ